MSFKVGDEVRTLKGGRPYYSKGMRGFVIFKNTAAYLVDFGDLKSAPINTFRGARHWWVRPSDLTHACPIARESAKLKADVERFAVEIDAWIERMRRGEW